MQASEAALQAQKAKAAVEAALEVIAQEAEAAVEAALDVIAQEAEAAVEAALEAIADSKQTSVRTPPTRPAIILNCTKGLRMISPD